MNYLETLQAGRCEKKSLTRALLAVYPCLNVRGRPMWTVVGVLGWPRTGSRKFSLIFKSVQSINPKLTGMGWHYTPVPLLSGEPGSTDWALLSSILHHSTSTCISYSTKMREERAATWRERNKKRKKTWKLIREKTERYHGFASLCSASHLLVWLIPSLSPSMQPLQCWHTPTCSALSVGRTPPTHTHTHTHTTVCCRSPITFFKLCTLFKQAPSKQISACMPTACAYNTNLKHTN